MTAVARDHRDKKYRATGWQLVSKRNGKRLLRQLRIDRFGQCAVVILFFLNARRLQAKLVQFVPGLFIGIMADNCKNRRAQIRRERRWIGQTFFETLPATCNNLWVAQISQSIDQARAQISGRRWFTLFRLPAQPFERRTQKRSGVALKISELWIADKEAVDEIQHIDDLFAFGKVSGSGQFLDQSEIERDRRAIGLNQGPRIAQKIDAIFTAELRQSFEQQFPRRRVVFDPIISSAVYIQFEHAISGNVLQLVGLAGHQQSRRHFSNDRIGQRDFPFERRRIFEIHRETLLCKLNLSVSFSLNFHHWESGLFGPAGSDLADRLLRSFRERVPQICGGRV